MCMPELADEARLRWAVETADIVLFSCNEGRRRWIGRRPTIDDDVRMALSAYKGRGRWNGRRPTRIAIEDDVLLTLCEFTGDTSGEALKDTNSVGGVTFIDALALRQLNEAAWKRARLSPMSDLFTPSAVSSSQHVPPIGLQGRRQVRRHQANSRAIAGAIAKVAPGERARWAEEWAADLETVTGAVQAWKWRLGLRLNARRMCHAAVVPASPPSRS